MPAHMIVETQSGNKLIFGGNGPVTGLDEVGIGENVVKATGAMLKKGLGTMAELISMLEESVGQMPRRPDKVEMEFRASLSGECDLWIVSGDGEAEFTVTLAWGNGE